MDNVERFIKYIKIDTQADGSSGKTPSSEKEKNLSKILVEDLKNIGLTDAYMDQYGIVYAHLKGEGDKIGFNAHIDTALEVTDENVNPQIIKNYDGTDIKLNDKYVLSKSQFPSLNKHIGKDLIVTDGNTLLGADDKAGIAIIISALEYFHKNPEVKHKNISICFTVDEEIGEGPDHFDLKKMDADYAYTIDGADINCVEAENFNAKGVKLKITGVVVHPGEGKNALVNASLLVSQVISSLPQDQTPFEANEDEGYWHINSINGDGESCTLEMILRDFDKEKLDFKAKIIFNKVEELKIKYPKAKFELDIYDQYENMKPYIDKYPFVIKYADEALIKNGLTPKHLKTRGGTDGATFSKMGLPTPNLGTGSTNHHGRYEYLVVQDYQKMIDVVIDLMKA